MKAYQFSIIIPFLLLQFLFAFPAISVAQKEFDLSVMGGLSNYSGDLQEKQFTLKRSHAAFGLGISHIVMPKVSVGLLFRYGKVSGHDKYSTRSYIRDRNLNFYSSIFDVSLNASYDFLDTDYSSWTPYVTLGVGAFHFNPHAEGIRNLRQYSTEGQGFIEGKKPYKLTAVSIPFGAGVKFLINDNIRLGYEFSVRKTFTDYVDDVSTTYVDEDMLRANRGQIAVDIAFRTDELYADAIYPPAGELRGSPESKDWIYFSGITLSFRLRTESDKLFGNGRKQGIFGCPRNF